MSTSATEDAQALLELKEGGPEPQSKKQKLTHERVADVFGDRREVQKIVVPAFMPEMGAQVAQATIALVQRLVNDGFSYEGALPAPACGLVYSRPTSMYHGKLVVLTKLDKNFKVLNTDSLAVTAYKVKEQMAAAAESEGAKE